MKVPDFLWDNESGRIKGYVPIYFFFYSRWQKFIHRFDYHHMKPNPTNEFAWCHWCGLRDKIIKLPELESNPKKGK